MGLNRNAFRMTRSLRILVAPCQSVLSSSVGSESNWAYQILANMASDFDLRIDAVCGRVDVPSSHPNLRLHAVGFHGGGLLDRVRFFSRMSAYSHRLAEEADIVHHMFPFGFKNGFNPLATCNGLAKNRFVIGPIQYPQEFVDSDDYAVVTNYKISNNEMSFRTDSALLTLASGLTKSLHRKTLRMAGALVFDSRKSLSLFRQMYPNETKGKRIEVIQPGIELDAFSPATRQLGSDGRLEILSGGYLIRRKGMQFLIKAMPHIVEEFEDATLRIVGEGPYEKELRLIVKQLDLERIVRFHGKVDRVSLAQLLRECTVYVQPSLSESFPSVVREAMATGKTVVSTDSGFVEEHISNGYNGFIVPKGNPRALAEVIAKLLGDQRLLGTCGARARKYAEQHFDWKKIAEAWFQLYQYLVNS